MLVITNLPNVVGPISTRLKTKDQVDYTIYTILKVAYNRNDEAGQRAQVSLHLKQIFL